MREKRARKRRARARERATRLTPDPLFRFARARAAESKPKLLVREGLVPPLVKALVDVIAATKTNVAGAFFQCSPLQRLKDGAGGDDDDDDEDWDGPSVQETVQSTLDKLALEVPMKHFFAPTFQLICAYFEPGTPQTWHAAAVCLGVIVEGAQDRIREQLPQVLAMLARAAEHGDATTRECVCFAYGQLAEHCQPEILAHHRQVLPVVFALMDTGAESVMGISCHVLETFCESMEEQHVVPILDDLATKLLVLLQHPKPSLREMAAAAIGTTALAAKEAFLPYLDRTARPLCQYASENLGSEAEHELRGRALEALGYLGMAVGNDAFEPYLGAANASATHNLSLDSLDLAEFTYARDRRSLVVDGYSAASLKNAPTQVRLLRQHLQGDGREVRAVPRDARAAPVRDHLEGRRRARVRLGRRRGGRPRLQPRGRRRRRL